MHYPIAIQLGDDAQAWSIVVPDLPGCFSAVDSGVDEALRSAKEAIELWIETALDTGLSVPAPSSVADLQALEEFRGWIWAIVEIDPALLSDDIERVNITLPRRILARLDERARQRGETRSGLIAQLAMQA